jgi:hypothetical protein
MVQAFINTGLFYEDAACRVEMGSIMKEEGVDVVCSL